MMLTFFVGLLLLLLESRNDILAKGRMPKECEFIPISDDTETKRRKFQHLAQLDETKVVGKPNSYIYIYIFFLMKVDLCCLCSFKA